MERLEGNAVPHEVGRAFRRTKDVGEQRVYSVLKFAVLWD